MRLSEAESVERQSKLPISSIVYWLVFVLMIIASVALFFHRQIETNFNFVFGDTWDGRIMSVLLSHWLKTAMSIQTWNQVPYFYPYADTLGYNDGGFITGMLTVPFRLLGVDVYRAPDCAVAVLKLVGFIAMARLLDRLVARRSLASLFGAALFTLMIASANDAGHTQLLTVALAPLQFLLLLKALDRLQGPPIPFLIWSTVTLVLMGAWLITSFYMAWFFLLFCLFLLGVWAILDFGSVRMAVKILLANRGCRLIGVMVVFAASITPFLIVYLPKLIETKGYAFSEALIYRQHLYDIINTGPDSLIWGELFSRLLRIWPEMARGEASVGFTPDIIIMLLVFAGLVIVTRTLRLTPILLGIAWTTLILLILPISLGPISLWWLVFKFVPGATGIRVIARLWLMTAFPVCLLVTCLIHHWGCARRGAWFAVPLAVLALAGQFNMKSPVFLDVASELAFLNSVPPPPPACQSFFVTRHSADAEDGNVIVNLYSNNVAAMAIADKINIPTIQGFSTFNPPDWKFEAFPASTYMTRVKRYVTTHKLDDICGYDLQDRIWTTKPFD